MDHSLAVNKLQTFVATRFREDVQSVCQIQRLQVLCTVEWSDLTIRFSVLSFGNGNDDVTLFLIQNWRSRPDAQRTQ